MEEELINKLNLDVLRRLDKEIQTILYRSRYAALHELDRASKIWHACEKAGPLFIVNLVLAMILIRSKISCP